MKRGFALLLAFLLFTAALMAAGCGSGKTQTQEYMKKGDAQLESFDSKTSAWSGKINAIGANPATTAVDIQQARAAGDDLLVATQAAKSEFEKIKRLDGVSDYKKYADLRIAECDILGQIMQAMNRFLDKRLEMAASGDLSFYPRLQQQAQNEIDVLSEKGQKLEEEADKLKSDKKL